MAFFSARLFGRQPQAIEPNDLSVGCAHEAFTITAQRQPALKSTRASHNWPRCALLTEQRTHRMFASLAWIRTVPVFRLPADALDPTIRPCNSQRAISHSLLDGGQPRYVCFREWNRAMAALICPRQALISHLGFSSSRRCLALARAEHASQRAAFGDSVSNTLTTKEHVPDGPLLHAARAFNTIYSLAHYSSHRPTACPSASGEQTVPRICGANQDGLLPIHISFGVLAMWQPTLGSRCVTCKTLTRSGSTCKRII